MSTSQAPDLTTHAGHNMSVGVVADQAVVEALAPRKLVNETDWFELEGIRVKAVKVAPSLYQTAQSHLRTLMRINQPKPPMQEGPDGKLRPNPHTKEYLAEMAAWEALYSDIDSELFLSVAVLAGLIIHPEDEQLIPAVTSWLPTVKQQLKSIGIKFNESSEFVMYGGDTETLYTLIYKKYFLLRDAPTYKAFMNFQKEQSPEGIPTQLLSRYSADMFQPEEG